MKLVRYGVYLLLAGLLCGCTIPAKIHVFLVSNGDCVKKDLDHPAAALVVKKYNRPVLLGYRDGKVGNIDALLPPGNYKVHKVQCPKFNLITEEVEYGLKRKGYWKQFVVAIKDKLDDK